MKDLSKITEIEDLRRVAERKVPFYDYVDSGLGQKPPIATTKPTLIASNSNSGYSKTCPTVALPRKCWVKT